jgi:hypothetical protein
LAPSVTIAYGRIDGTVEKPLTAAVFDDIPLTALALRQGGYDWSFVALCGGFGGSMVWFGSSAGVASANMYRRQDWSNDE